MTWASVSSLSLSGGKLLDYGMVALVCCTLSVAYLLTLASGPTWANGGSDSGELIAATAIAGVAHPTGYPTYLVLGRMFQFLPVGDLAFRSHIFSATAAVCAAVCVYVSVRLLPGNQCWHSPVAAGLATLWFGFSPVYWSQAIVAEVYSLNALFVGIMLLLLHPLVCQPSDQSPESPSFKRPDYHAIIVGLALGNHITIALPIGVWLAASFVVAPPDTRLWLFIRRLGWLGVGLCIYLIIPIRAAAQPPINWGGADDWTGFWWLISGQPYRDFAFGLPPDFLSQRIQAWAVLLLQQFGWVGLVLGFVGLLYAPPTHQRLLWLTAGLVLAYSIFAIFYNTTDSYSYLLPVYLFFALWIGSGILLLLTALARWHVRATPVLAVVLLAIILWKLPGTAAAVDASDDHRAAAFAFRVLDLAPPQALVVTSNDYDTFPLWYYHFAQGERPDIAVLVEPLLGATWYRDNLQATYPDLTIPAQPADDWLAAIQAANSGRSVCFTNHEETIPLQCGTDRVR